MTNLTFKKDLKTGSYFTYLKIGDVASLHIVRESGGHFAILQSSVEIAQDTSNHSNEPYATVEGCDGTRPYGKAVDMDLKAEVYPKYLKIVSGSAVTSAVATGDDVTPTTPTV